MDYNTINFLRGTLFFVLRIVARSVVRRKVALFLLCMPVIAAPFQALAVLGMQKHVLEVQN